MAVQGDSSSLFGAQKHVEGQSSCNTAPSCQQFGSQTSDRTLKHHHCSLERACEWMIKSSMCTAHTSKHLVICTCTAKTKGLF